MPHSNPQLEVVSTSLVDVEADLIEHAIRPSTRISPRVKITIDATEICTQDKIPAPEKCKKRKRDTIYSWFHWTPKHTALPVPEPSPTQDEEEEGPVLPTANSELSGHDGTILESQLEGKITVSTEPSIQRHSLITSSFKKLYKRQRTESFIEDFEGIDQGSLKKSKSLRERLFPHRSRSKVHVSRHTSEATVIEATETLTQRYSDGAKLDEDLNKYTFSLELQEPKTVRSMVSRALRAWSPTKTDVSDGEGLDTSTCDASEEPWNPYSPAKKLGQELEITTHPVFSDEIRVPTMGIKRSSRFGTLSRRLTSVFRKNEIDGDAEDGSSEESDSDELHSFLSDASARFQVDTNARSTRPNIADFNFEGLTLETDDFEDFSGTVMVDSSSTYKESKFFKCSVDIHKVQTSLSGSTKCTTKTSGIDLPATPTSSSPLGRSNALHNRSPRPSIEVTLQEEPSVDTNKSFLKTVPGLELQTENDTHLEVIFDSVATCSPGSTTIETDAQRKLHQSSISRIHRRTRSRKGSLVATLHLPSSGSRQNTTSFFEAASTIEQITRRSTIRTKQHDSRVEVEDPDDEVESIISAGHSPVDLEDFLTLMKRNNEMHYQVLKSSSGW